MAVYQSEVLFDNEGISLQRCVGVADGVDAPYGDRGAITSWWRVVCDKDPRREGIDPAQTRTFYRYTARDAWYVYQELVRTTMRNWGNVVPLGRGGPTVICI